MGGAAQVLYTFLPREDGEQDGLGRRRRRQLAVSSAMLDLFHVEPLVQQHMVPPPPQLLHPPHLLGAAGAVCVWACLAQAGGTVPHLSRSKGASGGWTPDLH